MTYRDQKGYRREHSNAVHRHRAYHHIYLKNRKKYPLPFEAYEVHHIDWDKNNNRMDNLAVLTPEEHDDEHESMEDYGMDLNTLAKILASIEKRYFLNTDEILEMFREKWEKFVYRVKSPSKEFYVIYNFKTLRGQYYKQYSELKGKIWKELIEELKEKEEVDKRKKKRRENFNLAKKWVIGKIQKKPIEKEAIKETLKPEEKKKYTCPKCGREINHKGNCLPCNAKAKREREGGSKSKRRPRFHKRRKF